MPLGNVVINAMDAAFQDREITFNRVGMHVAAHIFADAVIDGIVLLIQAAKALRCCAFVGINNGRAVKLGLKDRSQVLGVDLGDMMRANATLALYKRVNRLFANAARALVLTLAAMLVLLQSADESFIHLGGLAFAA